MFNFDFVDMNGPWLLQYSISKHRNGRNAFFGWNWARTKCTRFVSKHLRHFPMNVLVKNNFYKHVHRKLSILHDNTPRILHPSSISTKECIAPIPVLWYWILKEPRTVHVYKIEVEQNTKYLHCTTITFFIMNRIIFCFDGFQA